VFYDVNWNLELYQQVIERIGPVRQVQAGFDRPVHLYHLLAKDTIDFKVMKVLEGKATVQTALLDELK
jgi:SNF2 family DNA or RNA helicase